MKFYLALFLLSHSAFAIDVGDGSDGACNITGGGATQITSARRSYQCTTLNVDANLNDFKGGSVPGSNGAPLVIKVQGNVTIAVGVTIDLSGENGADGNTVAAVNGGRAGAGGFAGGDSTAASGSNGNGAGAGSGGTFAPRTGAPSSYGGGGGGGSYQTVAGVSPLNGDDNGNVIPAGANGTTYGPESSFDTSFSGGSGGAAGGRGIDATAVSWFGSSGAGGGGALRIISGGNIVVDGTIISKGGDGGGNAGTTTSSGGGGGASGGAVWLQAAGTLTVSGTGSITAHGGVGGSNDSGFAGFGGDGGEGRIRLDDADGVIGGAGTVSPAPYSTTFTPTAITSSTISMTRQYTSDVSCASVALGDQDKPFNNVVNLILGLAIAYLIHLVASNKSKV